MYMMNGMSDGMSDGEEDTRVSSGLGDADEKSGLGDTEPSDCCRSVREFAAGIAREQGGTELASYDGSKGNADPLPSLDRERVNCDPQGSQYELPREMYGNDGEPCCSEED